jgi:hypothetical protein
VRAKLLEDAGPPHSYMSSVSKPRCARGTNCYHVRKLRSEKPATVAHEGDLCEKCQKADEQGADALKKQDSAAKTRDYRRLESKASSDLIALKQELVLQLFMRRGPFWEAVKELRDRRNIKAEPGLPFKRLLIALPPPELAEQREQIKTEEQRKEWHEANGCWHDDLLSIVLEVVPERFRSIHSTTSFHAWYGFISACVLYDPPETALREFSEIGGPGATGLWIENANDHGNTYTMVASPIRRFEDPVEVRRVETEYWTALLDKLEELHLQPRGLNLADIIEDIHQKFPNIRRTRAEAMIRLNKRRYIEVDDYTKEADVREAFKMLTEAHKKRPRTGRPERDRLTCVEAAILHDRHNFTYEQLKERYGWRDETLASKYIKDGRGVVREGRKNSAEF